MSDLKSKVASLLAKAEKQESISLVDGCISFSVQYVLESGFKVSGVALYLESDAFTLLEARAIAKEHATSDLLKLETYAECQKAFKDRKIFTGTPIAPSFEAKQKFHTPPGVSVEDLREAFSQKVRETIIREQQPRGLLNLEKEDGDRRKEVMGALEKLTIEFGEDPAYESYVWDWSGMSLQELEKELEHQKKMLQIRVDRERGGNENQQAI